MNTLNKTESAVFLWCRFSVFLKDFFPDYLLLSSLCVEVLCFAVLSVLNGGKTTLE